VDPREELEAIERELYGDLNSEGTRAHVLLVPLYWCIFIFFMVPLILSNVPQTDIVALTHQGIRRKI
jgi:hypothetical protein